MLYSEDFFDPLVYLAPYQARSLGGNSFMAPQAGHVAVSTMTCWFALNPDTITKPQLPQT